LDLRGISIAQRGTAREYSHQIIITATPFSQNFSSITPFAFIIFNFNLGLGDANARTGGGCEHSQSFYNCCVWKRMRNI